MYLLHTLERVATDDKWYPRQHISHSSPGRWMADRRARHAAGDASRVMTDFVLVGAWPITQDEAEAINLATRDLLEAREKLLTSWVK